MAIKNNRSEEGIPAWHVLAIRSLQKTPRTSEAYQWTELPGKTTKPPARILLSSEASPATKRDREKYYGFVQNMYYQNSLYNSQKQ